MKKELFRAVLSLIAILGIAVFVASDMTSYLGEPMEVVSPSPSLMAPPDSSPIPSPSEIDNTAGPIMQPTPRQVTLDTQMRVMAWIYPGDPACAAREEYRSEIRMIHVLKAEYFHVSEEGELVLLTEEARGCNGYSPENVLDIKRHSEEQYVTVSADYAGSIGSFLDIESENRKVDVLVDFVVLHSLTGVELDFEDFGGWTPEIYEGFKRFVATLGARLHGEGKKLMLDGPAISNQTEQNWFPWRYEDFSQLPVDHIVVMAYDYQFDHGSGKPVAPISWIKDVISWTLREYPMKDRISIGIPSYGYRGIPGTQKFLLRTYDQMKGEPGFATAVRDPVSHEMTWTNGGYVYFYQDSESLRQKRYVVERAGITSLSVWHLGGNLWFE